MGSKVRSVGALAVAACMAAGSLSACGPPRYHYLKAAEIDAYLRVPRAWSVFDQETYEDRLAQRLPVPALQRVAWAAAFDASPEPSLDNILNASAQRPAGFVQVKVLTPREHDELSLESLRNYLVPLDQLYEEEQAEPLGGVPDEDIEIGGMHGTRATWALRFEGGVYVYDQVALLDDERSRLLLLGIGCRQECYVDNQETIEQVIDSLRIRES